jgi:ATP-dependent DNA helicase RecG
VSALRGAGPKRTEAAAELGINSVGDLLWHLPHGYRDRTAMAEIADLRIGESTTVLAEVRSARVRPIRRRGLRAIVEAEVADSSGPMKAVWFNQAWVAEKLRPGAKVLLHGKLDRSSFRVEAHEIVSDDGAEGGLHTTGIVPVHPASERLKPTVLRDWAHQVMSVTTLALEPLPAELRTRLKLPLIGDALRAAHFPAER